MKKKDVEEYFELVKHLAARTGAEVNKFVKGVTGKSSGKSLQGEPGEPQGPHHLRHRTPNVPAHRYLCPSPLPGRARRGGMLARALQSCPL